MRLDADLCILNYYDADGRMGAAPGQGREPGVDRRRLPVVSVSLGDTARFLFGGCAAARSRGHDSASNPGDAFVFGGPAAAALSRRVAYRCPERRRRSSASTGRFNLTFRQY